MARVSLQENSEYNVKSSEFEQSLYEDFKKQFDKKN